MVARVRALDQREATHGMFNSLTVTDSSSFRNRYNDDSVSRDIINNDLSNDKPAWPLSNWAGHQEAPRNIIDGIEVSPEEARVAYYLARLEGREQAAVRILILP